MKKRDVLSIKKRIPKTNKQPTQSETLLMLTSITWYIKPALAIIYVVYRITYIVLYNYYYMRSPTYVVWLLACIVDVVTIERWDMLTCKVVFPLFSSIYQSAYITLDRV